jgi:hypothetical protein
MGGGKSFLVEDDRDFEVRGSRNEKSSDEEESQFLNDREAKVSFPIVSLKLQSATWKIRKTEATIGWALVL